MQGHAPLELTSTSVSSSFYVNLYDFFPTRDFPDKLPFPEISLLQTWKNGKNASEEILSQCYCALKICSNFY